MTDPVAKLDFKKIEFPSDKITINDLRRVYPLGFDEWVADRTFGSVDEEINGSPRLSLDGAIGDLMDYEREFAEQAFLQALGVPVRPGREYSHQNVVDTFRSQYIELGLASGDHQVSELVRGVERQAVAQANQYLGRRP